MGMAVHFLDTSSLWLDIKIIMKTVMVVLKRDGVKTDGYATFLRFDDYRKEKKIDENAEGLQIKKRYSS